MNENDNIQLEDSDNVELSNSSLVIETPLENKEDKKDNKKDSDSFTNIEFEDI